MLFYPFIKKYCIVCVCLVWFPLVSAVGVRLRSSDRQRLPAAAADPNSRGQQWRRSLQDRSHACLERNVLRSDGTFLIILITRGTTILKYMFFFPSSTWCICFLFVLFFNRSLASVPTCLLDLDFGCCQILSSAVFQHTKWFHCNGILGRTAHDVKFLIVKEKTSVS